MPPINWPPRSLMVHFVDSVTTPQQQRKPRSRPLPLRMRTYSVAGNRSADFEETRDGIYPRHKSISHTHTIDNAHFTPASPLEDSEENETLEQESPRPSLEDEDLGSPETPQTSLSSQRSSLEVDENPDVLLTYDFSQLDYELERAKVLGQGLWSTVYLAEPKKTTTTIPASSSSSSSSSPRRRKSRTSSTPLLFAIKTPARHDARKIFHQEARVLSHLQRRSGANVYIVPFHGLDLRNSSLVFEAITGGSLEDLTSRLRVMPEVARHMELISLFPSIAFDLISGLEFLHSNAAGGVIHADIKPANILLEISQQQQQDTGEEEGKNRAVVRARYIDFSAAFMPAKGDSASDAGGTWDFMAPEQMRIHQVDSSMPTFASDVWSLGMTLLSLMVGGSPYAAACGNNNFMLREAVKSGDPIGFAKMDPVPAKRLTACQDFVDCCRMALKKDRENRVTAAAWSTWLAESEWEVGL